MSYTINVLEIHLVGLLNAIFEDFVISGFSGLIIFKQFILLNLKIKLQNYFK